MKPRTVPCRIGGVEMYLPLERGIKIQPIEYKHRNRGDYLESGPPYNRWPWKHMRNHDSVLIPYHYVRSDHVTSSARSYALNNPGIKFVVRSLDSGIRVWRKDIFTDGKKPIDRTKGTR